MSVGVFVVAQSQTAVFPEGVAVVGSSCITASISTQTRGRPCHPSETHPGRLAPLMGLRHRVLDMTLQLHPLTTL